MRKSTNNIFYAVYYGNTLCYLRFHGSYAFSREAMIVNKSLGTISVLTI